MCPIETPEGPNIGLIGQLSTFATVDEYGFVQTPYRKVENGKLTDEIEYLSADEEEEFTIAQANTPVDPRRARSPRTPRSSPAGGAATSPPSQPEEVDYMDVAPLQTVSVGDGFDPVPRARRRQQRAHGREHAAAGRAAPQERGSLRRDGDGVPGATDTGDVLLAHSAGTVERVDGRQDNGPP